MNLLLDTQILLWVAFEQRKVPPHMRSAIEIPENTVSFSVAALWEVSIKRAAGRRDFDYDPRLLRRNAIDAGYLELGITGDHMLQFGALPLLHRDPFDRILIAQAQVEGFVVLTADWLVRQYPNLALL